MAGSIRASQDLYAQYQQQKKEDRGGNEANGGKR